MEIQKLYAAKQDVLVRASISDICNFNCVYCAKDLGMENHTPSNITASNLTAKQYISNMVLLHRYGFKGITFTGGEPLLNPKFPEILIGCRPLFERIEVTTNGSNLLENLNLIENYVDVLKISCDGLSPDTQTQIAQNPLAKNTLAIIKECCSSQVNCIGINFVVMKRNVDELFSFIDFISALNERTNQNIYISLLDLYYSKGNHSFWIQEFFPFSSLRELLAKRGIRIYKRQRTGTDSYTFHYKNVKVNMKDSFASTNRGTICENCREYCQEGMYALKHSMSGWVSVCPTNSVSKGFLLKDDSFIQLNTLVQIINESWHQEDTYLDFTLNNGL